MALPPFAGIVMALGVNVNWQVAATCETVTVDPKPSVPPNVRVTARATGLNPFDAAATGKAREPTSNDAKRPPNPKTFGPVYESHPDPNGLTPNGGPGNPLTVQKQSGVEVWTENVACPPATGKVTDAGVTAVTHALMPWVTVIAASPSITTTPVRARPVEFPCTWKKKSTVGSVGSVMPGVIHGTVVVTVRVRGAQVELFVTRTMTDSGEGPSRRAGKSTANVHDACVAATAGQTAAQSHTTASTTKTRDIWVDIVFRSYSGRFPLRFAGECTNQLDLVGVRVGNPQKLIDASFEPLGGLLPEQVVKEDPHRIHPQPLGPPELLVDRRQVKRLRLPHLQGADRSGGNVVGPDEPGLFRIPVMSLLF